MKPFSKANKIKEALFQRSKVIHSISQYDSFILWHSSIDKQQESGKEQ